MRMPEDHTPIAAPLVDPWPRLAWVLVSARLHSNDSALANRSAFVERLRGLGLAADPSRVSRWESGQHPIPDRVLLAYEETLGLRAGALVALSHSLLRSVGPHLLPGYPVPGPEELIASEDELEALIRQVTEPDDHVRPLLSGLDWLRLSVRVTRFEAIFLDPTLWSRLCQRLITELARTSGVDELQRYEACATLIGHPTARRRVLRALGEWLTNPDVQLVEPMVTLLVDVADTAANDLVIRLMSSPSPKLREGAVKVAAAKLARGHFDETSVTRLEQFTIQRLSSARPRPSIATLDLAVHLPQRSLTRVLSRVTDVQLKGRLLVLAVKRSLVPMDVGRNISRSVAALAHHMAPALVDIDSDPMLQRLIQEMLFHVSGTRRMMAARTLALSPYAQAVSHGCVELAAGPNGNLAPLAWDALEPLSHSHNRGDVLAIALGETRPHLQASALANVGLSPGRLSEGECHEVAEVARSAADENVLLAAVAAVGLSAPQCLAKMESISPSAARAAAWWRRLGPSLHDEDKVPSLSG